MTFESAYQVYWRFSEQWTLFALPDKNVCLATIWKLHISHAIRMSLITCAKGEVLDQLRFRTDWFESFLLTSMLYGFSGPSGHMMTKWRRWDVDAMASRRSDVKTTSFYVMCPLRNVQKAAGCAGWTFASRICNKGPSSWRNLSLVAYAIKARPPDAI